MEPYYLNDLKKQVEDVIKSYYEFINKSLEKIEKAKSIKELFEVKEEFLEMIRYLKTFDNENDFISLVMSSYREDLLESYKKVIFSKIVEKIQELNLDITKIQEFVLPKKI